MVQKSILSFRRYFLSPQKVDLVGFLSTVRHPCSVPQQKLVDRLFQFDMWTYSGNISKLCYVYVIFCFIFLQVKNIE